MSKLNIATTIRKEVFKTNPIYWMNRCGLKKKNGDHCKTKTFKGVPCANHEDQIHFLDCRCSFCKELGFVELCMIRKHWYHTDKDCKKIPRKEVDSS